MTGFHRTGQATALITLLIGVAFLIVAFTYAYGMLTHPIPGLVLPKPHPSGAVSSGSADTVDFGQMSAAAVQFILKLGALLMMTIVGSLVAARAVHLFHVASTPAARAGSDVTLSSGPGFSDGSSTAPTPAASDVAARQ